MAAIASYNSTTTPTQTTCSGPTCSSYTSYDYVITKNDINMDDFEFKDTNKVIFFNKQQKRKQFTSFYWKKICKL